MKFLINITLFSEEMQQLLIKVQMLIFLVPQHRTVEGELNHTCVTVAATVVKENLYIVKTEEESNITKNYEINGSSRASATTAIPSVLTSANYNDYRLHQTSTFGMRLLMLDSSCNIISFYLINLTDH